MRRTSSERSGERPDVHPTTDGLRWDRVLFCLVGLPVRTCSTKCVRTPWATYGLSASICAFSVWFWGVWDDPRVWNTYVFHPSHTGLSWWTGLFTYGFFHGNWAHLLGNLYFLILFGRHVECRFGRRRFLGLFFLSCVAGGLVHGLFSNIALIGASGGVFGVLVFYGLLFPRARVLWLPFGPFLRIILFASAWRLLRKGFPVKVYLAVFVGLQVVMVYEQLWGQGSISALAHLGGAAAGALIFLGWRRGWLP
ncbi:MAG: rhomboid family intramembrane serine protease [Opitutales bacterium]|nr:rhomboid family intramembrane serine protease [Opitutales bacterium]